MARRLDLSQLADRYNFAISLLVGFAVKRASLTEMRFDGRASGLSIWKMALTYPFALLRSIARRVLWQYIVSDMNAGSIFLVFGSLFSLFGFGLGSACWIEALTSGMPRMPGTVTTTFFLIIFSFQLLNKLLCDVQFAPRVLEADPSEFPTIRTESESLVRFVPVK